jgi:putative peptide zinc metalloprotease protein
MMHTFLRFRPDIEWVSYQSGTRWVARDPLSGSFYYFNVLERQAATLLDGNRSATEILSCMRRMYPGHSISSEWLSALISKLRGSVLLLPHSPTGTVASKYPSRRKQHGFLRQLFQSPLSIRLPIWRPTGFSQLFRLIGVLLFHRFVFAMMLSLFLLCVFLVSLEVLRQPERFLYDVSQIQGDRWILVVILFMVVKTLHELGHVLACARWNADCKEIGILFLFFTPCLYCDTTECWKLRSKWQRSAVAAAGIYVELIIASLAALVWLNTRDGIEHTLAASTMLMCSIGTVLINGNPCFKYDGYFILSDLWGIPNLSQQSSQATKQLIVSWLGGRKPERAEFDGSIGGLVLFAVFSTLYRWVVLLLLGWFVWSLLVPQGLGFLAIFLLASLFLGVLVSATRCFSNFSAEFFAPQPIRLKRFLILMALLSSIVVLSLTIPFPHYVRARGSLDFVDKSPIYASQTAVVESVGKIDLAIQVDETLIVLDSPDKKLEIKNLDEEIAFSQSKSAILKQSAVYEPAAAFELPTLLEVLQEQLVKRAMLARDLESLTIRAPADGFFLASNAKVNPPIATPQDRRLICHPTHPESLGCLVERGTLLGWFTKKRSVQFHALVSESDVRSIRLGMKAVFILDSNTSTSIPCVVTRISPDPIQELPSELIGDPMIIAIRNKQGWLQPVNPHYQVNLSAEQTAPSNILGACGSVFFKLEPKTLAGQIKEYITNTLTLSR